MCPSIFVALCPYPVNNSFDNFDDFAVICTVNCFLCCIDLVMLYSSLFCQKDVSSVSLLCFQCCILFWTPGLPDEVHSNRPCPSVSPSVR